MLNKMGETIALFRLYRDTGEEEWSIRAEELLDDIWNGCTEDMSLAYGDGLCGIGAGTEYLIQNGFVEGDADEILAEIDSRVFAAINARPPFDLSIEQGISGLACYLYHRLCYRKDFEEPVVLNLKEYTIYFIDWIAEALQDDATGKDYYEVYFILVLLMTTIMKDTPSISVLMPVRNAETFLKEAVDSILGQTFTDFEFIIIDDASTDRSPEIIRSYTDSRIKFIQNKSNQGNHISRNIGLEKACGKYIAAMDADDRALPERLLTQYHYMEQHPDVLACGCLFYVNSTIISKPLNDRDIRIALLHDNCFLHPSLFIRTEVMQAIGGYDKEYRYSADYDFVCRISLLGKITNLPDVLTEYRMHKEQISQKHTDMQKHYADRIRNNYREEIMKRMPPVSIVIPLRIESTEREANLHCVLQYLLRSPFVYIDLLEADKERHFFFTHHERIRYRFVHDEEPVFYRTHYLN